MSRQIGRCSLSLLPDAHAPGACNRSRPRPFRARNREALRLALAWTLQAVGEIVMATGNGVNDVPVLQGADIGTLRVRGEARSARGRHSIMLCRSGKIEARA